MHMKGLLSGIKHLVTGTVCLAIAFFLFSSLREITHVAIDEDIFSSIPDYNYIPDVMALKEEGKLSEALELTRFVLRDPTMPGQEDAKRIGNEMEQELSSLKGRSKRVASGFVTGSGNSIEEISGGIASDMIIWGDLRDIVKQGYFKVTGKDTDPVIAALAGIGLATEMVDVVDWAPAVLKAFRKIGALSRKFADFIIGACRKSVKTRKLDGTLKTVFTNLRGLVDKMGLARTSAVFKYVDTPEDLSAIAKVAGKNTDAAYFTVKNGGAEGVEIIKRLGDTDSGITAMAKAAKKGPLGIDFLKKGGKARKAVIKTRIVARVLKNLRLDRPQQLITELAKKSVAFRKAIWAAIALSIFASIIAFTRSGLAFRRMRSI